MHPPLLVCCFFYYRHRIHRDDGSMLLLLLLLLHQAATGRVPWHEHHFGTEHRLAGDYGYIEAYSGKPQPGSDYKDGLDYNTEDSYEYKQESDFRSGSGVDSEVNTKPKYLMLSVSQKCLCGKNDVESAQDATRIVGGEESGTDKHPWQAESY